MNSESPAAAFVRLCASGSSVRWTAPAELELTLAVPIEFSVLRKLAAAGIYAQFPPGSTLQRDFDKGGEGQVPAAATLGLAVPRQLESFAVARDVNDLLSLSRTVDAEAGDFVLCCDQANAKRIEIFCSIQDAQSLPANVRRYGEAIRLWHLLRAQSEFRDTANNQLLFFGMRRTEIMPVFSATDLVAEVSIEEIADFTQGSDASRVRRQIFVSALSEFLRDQTSGSAFSYLLRMSEQFARRLREGWAVHLAEHSPEKLALEGQKSALEFSEKLEKVVAGLEAKSLAIPIALLLAVKDLQAGAGWTTVNGILLSYIVLFAVTMSLVHWSQLSVLGMLRVSLTNMTKSLRTRGLEAKNPVLSELFTGLEQRCNRALGASWVMVIAAWCPVLVVIGVMYFADPKPVAGAVNPPTPAGSR